jgi:hypothetical protein
MEIEPIQISLSAEVQELLADNEIDLVSELQKLYPDQQIKKDNRAVELHENDDEREKSVALIILASAAGFHLVSQGIEKIINSLSNRNKAVVKEKNKSKISFLGLSVELENEREQN